MTRSAGAAFAAAIVLVVLAAVGAMAATPFASLELRPTTAAAGERVSGTGHGFLGGFRVEVRLGSTGGGLLWSGPADGAGQVHFAFTAPSTPGSYAVFAFHPMTSGSSAQAALEVVAPAPPPEAPPAAAPGAPAPAGAPSLEAAAGSPPVPVRGAATRSVPIGPPPVEAPVVAPVPAPEVAPAAGAAPLVQRAFSRAEGFTPAGAALLRALAGGKGPDAWMLVRLAIGLQLGVALLGVATVIRRPATT